MTGDWTVHKARVAADFGAAALSYDRAARLQRVVLEELSRRLAATYQEAQTVLDMGSGTGLGLPLLAGRYPEAHLLALDLAEGMVRHARERYRDQGSAPAWLVGDAEALPLAASSVDLVFSSLAVQWCENPAAVFYELARVIAPGGRLLLSTLVDGTLAELRDAWQEVDPGHSHVNRFLSAETLTAEVRRVFPQARVDTVPICLLYPDLMALLRELKGLGARYKDASKRSGATAPARLRRLEQAYGRYAGDDGLPATYQVAIVQV